MRKPTIRRGAALGVAMALVATMTAACGGDDGDTTTTAGAEEPTTTAAPAEDTTTTVAAEAELGSPERPVKVLFVPSVDAQVIVSGGEIPALAVVDAVVRLLPGDISDHDSAATDSFYDGALSPPSYTRPAEYRGMAVPPVLLSGDHARIAAWQREQAERLTRERRPELVEHPETS